MELKEKVKSIVQSLETGNKQTVKIAKKEIDKLYDEIKEKDKRELVAEEFISEMRNFDSIENPDNRANFIYALWPVFLCGQEKYFDFFADFLIDAVQDKNGKIRNAAVRIVDWLHPQFDPKMRKKVQEKVEKIEELLRKHFQPKFKKYKYIRSMPPGIYKSLEMLHYKFYRMKKHFLKKDLFNAHRNDKQELYYDAMELLGNDNLYDAEKFLERAFEIDEDFVAAYVGLTEVYKNYSREEEEKYTEIAWQKTLKKFPAWPEELNWGFIENRQYLRAICNKAMLLHKKRKKEEAEKIYRLLLKLNPGDNQGVRYLLAALFRGLMPEDVNKMNDEGNRKQDWRKLENMLSEENKKHKFLEYPEEEFSDDEYPEDEETPDEIDTPHGNA